MLPVATLEYRATEGNLGARQLGPAAVVLAQFVGRRHNGWMVGVSVLCVAMAGAIGFIGLVIPHILRYVV